MKLQQRSLDQTGVAILELENNEEKEIPLFSLTPVEEANTIAEKYFPSCKIKHVFITNNLMNVKIEDTIAEFIKNNNGVVPENLIEEILTGFPYVIGNGTSTKHIYG